MQAIWLGEVKVFQRETSRVISSIASPLLWLFFFGAGLGGRVVLDLPRGVGYTAFIYPGLIVMSVLFGSMFYGLYIVWDRKLDFLKEVLAAPIRRDSVFLGKVLGGTTDAIVQALLLLVLGALLLPFMQPGFQGLLPAGIFLALPVIFLLAVSIASLGLGIGTLFESFEGFQVVVSFIAFPMFFLSGGLFPVDGLPPALAFGVKINPLTYGVDALRQVLIGHGSFALAIDLGVIVGFALAMMAIGTWAFSRMKL
jgi:ABC-2 type transport system permease protein